MIEFTYLPHSFFNKPAKFKLNLTDKEAKQIFSSPYKTEKQIFFESWYKESFALLWLTDHHFSIVSEWYDITDDICKLVKSHPDYGNKYVYDFVAYLQDRNIGNTIVKSTLLLRDKERFLRAIAHEPPYDTKQFYKIISDSIGNLG